MLYAIEFIETHDSFSDINSASFIPISELKPSLVKALRTMYLAIAPFKCGEVPIILYNEHHSDKRNESTIMHELSHIILNHNPEANERLKNTGLLLRSYDQIHENEAEWLGACLQLPVDGLVSALLKGKSIHEISLQYGASLDMVKYRINTSGAKRKVYNIKKKYS